MSIPQSSTHQSVMSASEWVCQRFLTLALPIHIFCVEETHQLSQRHHGPVSGKVDGGGRVLRRSGTGQQKGHHIIKININKTVCFFLNEEHAAATESRLPRYLGNIKALAILTYPA
jgi:hypothetical protein